MRYIQKGPQPEALKQFKDLENENWKATYGGLTSREKRPMFEALWQEQGYICCYCEQRLIAGDCHIDHCRPQSDPQVDPLDFNNMVCSCQNQLKKGEPRHCGNTKGDWYDDERFLSPLKTSSEGRFRFQGDGRIVAKSQGDEAAEATIAKLNLGCSKLRDMRKKALDPFLDQQVDLSAEEFVSYLIGVLKKDEEGKYPAFMSAIRDVFAYPDRV